MDNYICEFCSSSFSTKYTLTTHKKRTKNSTKINN